MAHKYLNDILPKGKTPYDFEFNDEIRNQKWESEKQEFGFDERERGIWILHFSVGCMSA